MNHFTRPFRLRPGASLHRFARWTTSVGIIACLLVFGIPAFAQSTGTVQGVVTDNTGAVIPGAEVKVTNIETGVEITSTTNEVGFYAVPSLNPG